ncbi:MAG: hypothetical protein ABH820_02820, partial [Patescibacteria group bacterium]
RIMLAFENSSVQAEWYGRQWTFLNDLKNPEEKMKQIEKVRVKDVQRVAKAILKPEKMATAVIGPYSKNDIERLIKRKTK